jgi:hypothetical protein
MSFAAAIIAILLRVFPSGRTSEASREAPAVKVIFEPVLILMLDVGD